MNNPAPANTVQDENIQRAAKKAFELMAKFAVPPIPENYAVWFAYAQGNNQELSHEVDKILKNKLPFSKDTCSYLSDRYVNNNRNQKVLDDAALNSQKILAQVLKVVNEFSEDQQSYNKDVDTYIDDISDDIEDENLRDMVKNIVSATVNLKESGEKITAKLEESKQEISSLRKNLQQVTVEAQRDFLTGVFNRKTFEKMFTELSMEAAQEQKDLCLIMMDIDHFKKFNDNYGHLLGDEVLKIVARTLTETLKGRDVVARFGGEEFVVVLPDTPLEGAMKVADMIRTSIASKQLKRKDTGQNFGTITVSMGVSYFKPENDSLPTLIKRADDALYKSKENGRNQVSNGEV